ncbi:hypothetical protein [Sulfuritalea sp.]|uniref:hypothetical protein n=1 Tax=Sulfuritalea sp. TaxID=2480090 RepID=UPI001AC796F2|nr:hypothetical protein [Sulfuritalea sp.]MBN8473557.1 hypothetical protein [Sulfuritalea sp.]
MAARRILLLDGSSLTAYHWNGGRIKVEGEFSPEPVGIEAFAGYLKKHRASLFYLLADTGDEGFQLEDLPYVQGSDRAALLQRRLSQYFYNTPLATAIPLGRATGGRRDEKILFAALTRIESFTPWLEAIEAAEAMLAGVYSIPLVLAGCGPQVVGAGGTVLFVSLTHGGVRQSFLDGGRLHFSRLSQLATQSVEEIGRACANESAKIYQYLVAQRQLPRGTTLRTVVLAHSAQMQALQDFCHSSAELQFEFIDLSAAARKQGLKDPLNDSSADKLFIHCLITKTPPQQFAPARVTRFHKLWQIRSAITSVGWLILAGCLLYAGKSALEIKEVMDRTDTIRIATGADTQRYNGLLADLPKINLTPENLRALTGRHEALQKRMPAMTPLLTHLGRALNESPRIELVRLSWKLADVLDAAAPAPGSAASGTSAPPAVVPAVGAGWAILELEGQLPLVMVSDQRAQIELIENFASRLRDAKTDVRVLSRPFDIESDKPLRSASDANKAQPAAEPKFSLRIARTL